jgi:hypothetical protein
MRSASIALAILMSVSTAAQADVGLRKGSDWSRSRTSCDESSKHLELTS